MFSIFTDPNSSLIYGRQEGCTCGSTVRGFGVLYRQGLVGIDDSVGPRYGIEYLVTVSYNTRNSRGKIVVK